MMPLRFQIIGLAQSAGSKQSFVPIDKRTGQPYRDKHGRVIVNTVDDNPKAKAWKRWCFERAKDAMQGVDPWPGPIAIRATFWMPRPKIHFRANGELKPKAPRYHQNKPDATKLFRALEDGLTGAIWVDDKQVVAQLPSKRYTSGQPCVDVVVRFLSENAPADLFGAFNAQI